MKYYNTLLLTTLLLFSFSPTHAQGYKWGIQTGSSSDESGVPLALDNSGNMIAVGSFSGTVDFDPGSGTASLTSKGGTDIYIQKLDPSGNLIWAKSIGGSGDDHAYAVCVDAKGNIMVTGNFSDTVDFDPGTGVQDLIAVGGLDFYMARYDAMGNYRVAVSAGSSKEDNGYAIAVDNYGYIYTTGSFTDTADFDPTPGVFNLISAGDNDIFVAVYDSTGAPVSATSGGSTGTDLGLSIYVDNMGYMYLGGTFSGTVDFDGGAATYNLVSNGYTDAFVAKYSTLTGDIIWAKGTGGKFFDGAYALAVDKGRSVYVFGNFTDTVDFDPGSGTAKLGAVLNDAYLQKLDSNGSYVWALQVGGAGDDFAAAMSISDSGHVHIGGSFENTVDFDPGPGTSTMTAAGSNDGFIAKYDTSGKLIWAGAFTGSGSAICASVKTDAAGMIYAGGYFDQGIDLDPYSSTDNYTSKGMDDNFIVKLLPVPMSVSNINLSQNFSMYPNPSREGMVHIVLDKEYHDVTVLMTGMTGRVVHSSVINNSSSFDYRYGNIPAGVYLISIHAEGSTFNSQLTIK